MCRAADRESAAQTDPYPSQPRGAVAERSGTFGPGCSAGKRRLGQQTYTPAAISPDSGLAKPERHLRGPKTRQQTEHHTISMLFEEFQGAGLPRDRPRPEKGESNGQGSQRATRQLMASHSSTTPETAKPGGVNTMRRPLRRDQEKRNRREPWRRGHSAPHVTNPRNPIAKHRRRTNREPMRTSHHPPGHVN